MKRETVRRYTFRDIRVCSLTSLFGHKKIKGNSNSGRNIDEYFWHIIEDALGGYHYYLSYHHLHHYHYQILIKPPENQWAYT